MGRVETHDEARRRLKIYETGHRRRAREQGCELKIVDLWEIVEEQGFMCAICHEPLVFELDSKRSVSTTTSTLWRPADLTPATISR